MQSRLEDSRTYHKNILLLGFPGILTKMVLELHLMLPKGDLFFKVVVSCSHWEVRENDYWTQREPRPSDRGTAIQEVVTDKTLPFLAGIAC